MAVCASYHLEPPSCSHRTYGHCVAGEQKKKGKNYEKVLFSLVLLCLERSWRDPWCSNNLIQKDKHSDLLNKSAAHEERPAELTMRFAFKKTCLQMGCKKMTWGRARTTETHRCLHLVPEVVRLTPCDQISLPPESLQLEGQRSLCMVTLTTLYFATNLYDCLALQPLVIRSPTVRGILIPSVRTGQRLSRLVLISFQQVSVEHKLHL